MYIGPRYVVQFGDKAIDYNEDFHLFLTTRNPLPDITPDAASVISEVNFTTTKAGLTAQVCRKYQYNVVYDVYLCVHVCMYLCNCTVCVCVCIYL